MQTTKWFEQISFTDKVEINLMQESSVSKEIRITMPKDTLMKEHKAPNDILVQVLSGKIWFEVNNEKFTFSQGDMLSLKALIPHSLGGLEDSIIRLSLSKNDSEKRVEEVAR